MFNLSAPPGFRGLDADRPVFIYYRHLPHWRQAAATYFVTFRLADALPQNALHFLKRLREEWERTHPAPRSQDDWETHARDLFRREEAWLDASHGSCILREPSHANILADAILYFQDDRYLASAWVIMPNHCHLVIQPHEGWELETILQGMKGTVTRRINQRLGRAGPLWQQESYDRIVRDEEHL
jgi:REP-associated tyrosine transposase